MWHMESKTKILADQLAADGFVQPWFEAELWKKLALELEADLKDAEALLREAEYID